MGWPPAGELLDVPDSPAVHVNSTVNAICPGAANSAQILGPDAPAMTGGVGASEDAIRKVTPAGRRGTLGEGAAAAVYLASEGSAYVTGQALVIDGGWTAA